MESSTGGRKMRLMKNKLVLMLTLVALLGSAVAASAAPAEKTTASKVRKQLVTIPYYGVFDNLEYKIDGDTVTLYGQVRRPIIRKDAERRVQRIEGVERVINNIEVLPLSS